MHSPNFRYSYTSCPMSCWDERSKSIFNHSLQSQLRSPVTRRHDSSLTNSSGVRGRIHSPPPHLQRCHDSSSLVSLLSGRVHEQQKVWLHKTIVSELQLIETSLALRLSLPPLFDRDTARNQKLEAGKVSTVALVLLQEISALRESVDYLQSTVQEQNRQIRTLKGNIPPPMNHDPLKPMYTPSHPHPLPHTHTPSHQHPHPLTSNPPHTHTPSHPTPTYIDEMVQIQKRLSESAADLRTGRELKQVRQ